MLIIVHYGDASRLLVNGDCQSIHLLNYIRTRCCLSSSIKFDLCSINTGEPFHLSSTDSKHRLIPSPAHCVLTRIDEEGTYIPLLNDSTLITNEFLTKLKRATATTKVNPSKINLKTGKHSNHSSDGEIKKRRSFRSFAIAATVMKKSNR